MRHVPATGDVERAVLDQRRQKLLDEQRVAFCTLEDLARGTGNFGSDDFRNEATDVLVRQRLEPDPFARRPAPAPGRAELEKLRPGGREEHHRCP